MKRLIYTFTFLIIIISSCAKDESNDNNSFVDLKNTLDSLTETGIIPGISMSVFTKDSILIVHTSGYADLTDSIEVDRTTKFEAASLSKPIVAHIYLKNFQNKLPLDTSLLSFYDQAVTNNTNYLEKVSPFLILSHQSGLPNWRAMPNTMAGSLSEVFNKTDSLNFRFEPGSEFGYSGEGYLWLQGAIEKVSSKPFQQIASETIFGTANTENSTFIYPEIDKNTSSPYDENNERVSKQIINITLASASLHSNAQEYARMFQQYLKDKSTILDPVVKVDTVNNFEIKWAPGIGIMSNNEDENYLFHWGDNGSFKSYVIYDANNDLGFVYFSNSSNGLKIRNIIVDKVYNKKIPMWPGDYEQLK
ncbi:serine hydrolase [Mangrovivirga sp. M17]|uniref:Serine hydrolase n=1 Tax=Mangrovivirga halotolerans TaxID=2993936 RepID=A0ABT3RLJ8_9BACT|nr:serine hydrolase domain-containing protein [Mangrovivirga halotolerans]MCX2742341.1 serine hydrolase [Mangrovivirga halotolerans]